MDSEIYNLKKVDIKEKNNSNKLYIFILIIIFMIILFIFNFILFFYKKDLIIMIDKKNIKEIIDISKKYLINDTNLFLLKNSNNNHEKIKLLKLMTNNNILMYKGIENCLLNDPDTQYCIYHLIYPKKVIGKNRILIGNKSDGCYVLLDDFKDIKYAYSFGIEKKIQFDKALADRGIDVYMYDHTINNLPYNNSRFHWKKIGIAGKNKTNNKLKTLEELILMNGHSLEKNMILKIDVEHCEWDSLKDLPDNILTQFKYIIIEYHFNIELNEAQLYYNVIKKLNKNHQVFYIRCHGRYRIVRFGNNIICQYLEVSYIIKENNQFTKDDSIYPIFEFDFMGPDLSGRAEINLNILKLFED